MGNGFQLPPALKREMDRMDVVDGVDNVDGVETRPVIEAPSGPGRRWILARETIYPSG